MEKREEQRGLKDKEQQKQFEALMGMFGSEAWKVYFTEFLDGLFEVANALEGVDTQRDLDYRRGQRDLIKILKAQPQVVEATYENALEWEESEHEQDDAV